MADSRLTVWLLTHSIYSLVPVAGLVTASSYLGSGVDSAITFIASFSLSLVVVMIKLYSPSSMTSLPPLRKLLETPELTFSTSAIKFSLNRASTRVSTRTPSLKVILITEMPGGPPTQTCSNCFWKSAVLSASFFAWSAICLASYSFLAAMAC